MGSPGGEVALLRPADILASPLAVASMRGPPTALPSERWLFSPAIFAGTRGGLLPHTCRNSLARGDARAPRADATGAALGTARPHGLSLLHRSRRVPGPHPRSMRTERSPASAKRSQAATRSTLSGDDTGLRNGNPLVAVGDDGGPGGAGVKRPQRARRAARHDRTRDGARSARAGRRRRGARLGLAPR